MKISHVLFGRDTQGERQDYAMRLAMKTFSRAILGAHRIASALLLSGFVLCNFGAQADVFYSKIGGWSVAYVEVGNLSGCRAAAQFPDQTIFQMVQIQSGTVWVIFISNPRWNDWIGKRKEHRLSLVTDWPTTKPWPFTFSTSGDSKTLSTTDASVEFMNSVADASKVEIKNDNGALLTTVDMKDSAAAIRAIVTCVREHPPRAAQSPEPETRLSGTGFFVAPNRVVTNNHVVSGCTKDIQVRYPNREAYTATISGQDATNDLVLLHTNMGNLSTAAFYPRLRVGDQVASYGFPYSGILSSDGNCTLGYVTSLTGTRDDTRFLQMSTPVQPGNSGGALLDMSGSVVGVVVAQLNLAKSNPQNVNFAIQPSMVINFLEVKDVIPKIDTPKAQRSSTEVCEIAKKFTVRVYCQGISPKTTESAGPLALSPSDVADFGTKFDVQATPEQGSTRP
jgi:serine protease Do